MPDKDEAVAEGVEVRETGRGRFQVEASGVGWTLLVDEPVAAGGLSSGPTPYELIASALGACTLMTMKLYAARKAWPLQSATVRVFNQRNGPGAKHRFIREIMLVGDLDQEQRHRLLEIANRCPVHQTLEQGSDVITVLTETPRPGGLDPDPCDHVEEMIEACQD